METKINFIGIDVSKAKLDIYSSQSKQFFQIANNKQEVSKLFKKFKTDNSIVIIENTGGYESECIKVLVGKDFFVHRTNNNKVRGFIEYTKGRGKAKTDKIDAMILAEYGESLWESENKNELTRFKEQSEVVQKIKALVRYSMQVKRLRASQKNIAQSSEYEKIKDKIDMFIENLNLILKETDDDIELLLEKEIELKKKISIIQEYKGVGRTTAIQLAINLEEIGQLDRKQIASISGVAPIDYASGTILKRKKISNSARPSIRPILFMACLSAITHNKELKKTYEDHVSRGKKKMVSLVACMRKMIVHINAKVRDEYYISS